MMYNVWKFVNPFLKHDHFSPKMQKNGKKQTFLQAYGTCARKELIRHKNWSPIRLTKRRKNEIANFQTTGYFRCFLLFTSITFKPV